MLGEGRGRGLRGLSQWVQLYTGAQINFGDLTQYLTYALHAQVPAGCDVTRWLDYDSLPPALTHAVSDEGNSCLCSPRNRERGKGDHIGQKRLPHLSWVRGGGHDFYCDGSCSCWYTAFVLHHMSSFKSRITSQVSTLMYLWYRYWKDMLQLPTRHTPTQPLPSLDEQKKTVNLQFVQNWKFCSLVKSGNVRYGLGTPSYERSGIQKVRITFGIKGREANGLNSFF